MDSVILLIMLTVPARASERTYCAVYLGAVLTLSEPCTGLVLFSTCMPSTAPRSGIDPGDGVWHGLVNTRVTVCTVRWHTAMLRQPPASSPMPALAWYTPRQTPLGTSLNVPEGNPLWHREESLALGDVGDQGTERTANARRALALQKPL